MTAVAIVRRRSGGARTGHAGTLDPLATGVLVLGLGRATRQLERFMATEKRYLTVVDLSAVTASGDAELEPEPLEGATPPTRREIDEVVVQFTGTIQQTPPIYSAMKVGGKRAYDLARRDKPVVLQPRPVVVHELNVVRYEWPLLELDIRCGKGLYVRSLGPDMGRVLGVGGYCLSIRRTAVGPFTLDDAWSLDDLPEPIEACHLIDLDEAMARLNPPTDISSK